LRKEEDINTNQENIKSAKMSKSMDCRLENKLRYPQPHSIKLNLYNDNEALHEHLIMKEHSREKYQARRKYKSQRNED
jgi:hypothetical protein